VKYYLRYADDFVFLSRDQDYLLELISKIDEFLKSELKLRLHPRKVVLQKWHNGVDFLGYVIFPHHIVLRAKTKKRIFRKMRIASRLLREGEINKESNNQTLQSYHGILKHCRGTDISGKIEKMTD